MATQVFLVLKDLMARRVLLVSRGHRGHLVNQAQLVYRALRGHKVLLALLEFRVLKESRVSQDFLVLKDHQVHLATQDSRDHLET